MASSSDDLFAEKPLRRNTEDESAHPISSERPTSLDGPGACPDQRKSERERRQDRSRASSMTAAEYRDSLKRLRLSHSAAAKTLRISLRSSKRYAKRGKVPGHVAELLGLRLSEMQEVKQPAAALQPDEPLKLIRDEGKLRTKPGYETSLEHLAAQIHEKHQQIRISLRTGIERACETGVLLVQAKNMLEHGKWLPWLSDNCNLAERTAQLYMKLAQNRDSLGDIPHLTIGKAVSMLAAPRVHQSSCQNSKHLEP
jgi:hypothetical protein